MAVCILFRNTKLTGVGPSLGLPTFALTLTPFYFCLSVNLSLSKEAKGVPKTPKGSQMEITQLITSSPHKGVNSNHESVFVAVVTQIINIIIRIVAVVFCCCGV